MATRRPVSKRKYKCWDHKLRVHPVKVHNNGHVDMECPKGCKLTVITVPSGRPISIRHEGASP